jgi:hypothetical protein
LLYSKKEVIIGNLLSYNSIKETGNSNQVFFMRIFKHLSFIIKGLYLKIAFFLWILVLSFLNRSVAQEANPQIDSLEENCASLGFTYVFQEKGSFHPVSLKDPIFIQLYEVKTKKLWAPPLRDTQLKTSGFGPRQGHFHHGIDLALRMGEPVFVVFDGYVKLSTYGGGYGNYVIIKHDNGLETLYAHLSKRKVNVGQQVKAGQLLGLGGSTGYSTGPHLHFEVRYQGYTINPQLVYDFKQKDQIRSDIFFIKPHHFRHYGNATPKQGYLFHEVGQNETLVVIASKYEVKPEEIIRLNGLRQATLNSGQMLRIR